jgi:hypothetical protein
MYKEVNNKGSITTTLCRREEGEEGYIIKEEA